MQKFKKIKKTRHFAHYADNQLSALQKNTFAQHYTDNCLSALR
jgi:hypothetical protein